MGLNVLQIHRSSIRSSSIIKTLCGYSYTDGPIVATSNSILIRFIANHIHEGSKFILRFEAIDYDYNHPGLRPVESGE